MLSTTCSITTRLEPIVLVFHCDVMVGCFRPLVAAFSEMTLISPSIKMSGILSILCRTRFSYITVDFTCREIIDTFSFSVQHELPCANSVVIIIVRIVTSVVIFFRVVVALGVMVLFSTMVLLDVTVVFAIMIFLVL